MVKRNTEQRETGHRLTDHASGTPEQIGQGFLDNDIIIVLFVMELLDDGFIHNPTEAEFVKKDNLFPLHSPISSLEHSLSLFKGQDAGDALPGTSPCVCFNSIIVVPGMDL